MNPVRALTAKQDGAISLKHFNFTSVVGLEASTESGFVVAFGKVVVVNQDNTEQDVQVQLRLGGDVGDVLDSTSIRLSESGKSDRQCIMVQSELLSPPRGVVIDIACATFEGTAMEARLTVLEAVR